jgi:hypothetical protein
MASSNAARLRAHKEAFQLAQQLGCTPREAEHQLRVNAARADWEAARTRIETKMAKPPRVRLRDLFSDEDEHVDREPWMMRN